MTRKSLLLWIIGGIMGAIVGYLYFLYYGCQGTCAITSKPLHTTIYGMLMGGLLFSMFDSKKEKS
jgi:hypothetical protein